MLATRHIETPRQPWSSITYDSKVQKSLGGSRMSNNFDAPLTTHPDWQGHYSFLPANDSSVYNHHYNHVSTAQNGSSPRTARAEVATSHDDDKGARDPPVNGNGSAEERVDHQAQKRPSPELPHSASRGGDVNYDDHAVRVKEEPVPPTQTPALSMGSTMDSANGHADVSPTREGKDETGSREEDDEDDLMDDEEIVEGENNGQPQTAAERIAQRRKMKRFRLTHQQTRFLMSEFAKQPHPDAAHRERLSREIPGLSPRQVQVWFQNRRAKIKRLTADDRDRMIKMRAVPDDFDNVQALHSPYGAVHGLGSSMGAGMDFGASSYAEHMMRPLMVDVRRAEGDDSMLHTGLSSAFGGVGFNASGAMSNSDILSPLSHTSHDRYSYGSSSLGTPLSAGPRTSNPFASRTSSLETSYAMQNARSQVRPLQPLQLRETLSRSRADSLQSPLRSSMSWKDGSLDYSSYHAGAVSPRMNGRQASTYSTDTPATLGGYEASSYTGATMTSPTNMAYPAFSSASTFPNTQARSSRLRAVSASLPMGLDLRTQFPLNRTQPAVHSATSPTNRHNTTFGGGVSAAYSSAFPTGPVTAPIDYSLGRTQAFPTVSRAEYSMSQMSAPIAPPNDFSSAFRASLTTTAHTPMRDSFAGHGHGRIIEEVAGGDEEYAQDGDMHQTADAKRPFNMAHSTSPAAPVRAHQYSAAA